MSKHQTLGKFERRNWYGLFALVLAPVILLGIYFYNVAQLGPWLEAEVPTGPDQFCYLRQAQLFEQKGIAAGFDTAIDFEGTRYLISKAKALGFPALPESSWIGTVAPHCHRYKAATDKLVSQYPPGTGFLLSFFPEGKRVRDSYIAIQTVALAWFLYLILFARNAPVAWTNCALGSFLLAMIDYEGQMSFSLPPTMLICTLLGYCTVKMLVTTGDAERNRFAVACGLLLGISVSMRTANILISGAFFLAFMDAYWKKPDRRIIRTAALFSISLAIALIPSLIANAINAGSPFATTYGGEDAAAPALHWRNIAAAADYYFLGEGIGFVFDAGIALTVLFELYRRRSSVKKIECLSFINTVTWLIAAAYYLTHEVLNSYYLIPTAMFSIALVVFGINEMLEKPAIRDGADQRTSKVTRVLACACISAGAVALFAGESSKLTGGPKPALPRFENLAVIWAEQSAGLFHYYLKKHTAMIDTAPLDLQRKMIDAVANDGRPQYFIADSDEMRALIARTPAATEAEEAFGYKTYRLAPR